MAKRKHKTAYKKVLEQIETEGKHQCTLLYGATALALSRHWGKKQTAITRIFDVSRDIWRECAATNEHSMLEMCEEETGIEVQNGSGRSWHDLPYLNARLDPGRMSNAQWVYMRQQQVKWIAPQVMACIILALHRKNGFGYDRCARIYAQVQQIQEDYRYDEKMIRTACMEEIGISIIDVFTKE